MSFSLQKRLEATGLRLEQKQDNKERQKR